MKKSLLILASILILAGCGNGQKNLTMEEIIDYGEIGYSDIVSFIVEGYQSGWEETAPEDMDLSPVYSYSSIFAGFAKKDIDGDGFDELLLGDLFEDGCYALYDIYCFSKKDASLIHLASGGERDSFVINGEGVIIETGSNSADESFVKGYRLADGRLVACGSWNDDLMKLEFQKFTDLANPQLCGGYTSQREPTVEEIAMFASVTGSGDLTLTPLSVSTQVVAGTNYKFWCRFQDGEDSGHCWVIIFKPLPGQGEPELSSIEKVKD